MTKRYLGNIITQNPTAPAGNFEGSAAKGVWSLDEQLAYQKAGLWPVPGNTPLDITDVFSTYLYEGNNNGTGAGPNPTRKITNGINLLDEGGLVWFKDRDTNPYSGSHRLMDSERSTFQSSLSSDSTGAQSNQGTAIINSVQDDGFTLGYSGYTNYTEHDHASWTFRKAPKFFDVVTYTGNGTAGRTISHNLGSVPGMIIVKQYQSGEARPWSIYHRGIDSSAPENYRISFTTGARVDDAGQWNDTAPTSSEFTVGGSTYVNNNGESYVAYLFAHNDGDGEFGPDGSDVIKCGSFSVNGSYEADVDIGFEPQWVLIKPAQDSGSWLLFDTMRGATVNGDAAWLAPDLSQQEANTANRFWPTATGFHIGNYGITAGNDIIYMAIRRGPLAAPESATGVFVPAVQGVSPQDPTMNSGFVTDFAFHRQLSQSDWKVSSRLTSGRYSEFNSAGSEGTDATFQYDFMDGYYTENNQTDKYAWMWKRGRGYFDVVAYTGNGTAGKTLSHNLAVAPEMMWVKSRGNAEDWYVYHKDLGNGSILILNSTSSVYNGMSNVWNNTSPTSSVFTVGTNGKVNLSGDTFISYLFASLPGISKVGSVSHTSGSATNVDCGFTSGARFILLKVTDSSGSWFVYDTARGIVAGNDARLKLESTAAENTGNDDIDPLSSGFTITSTVSTGSYIFYAIA